MHRHKYIVPASWYTEKIYKETKNMKKELGTLTTVKLLFCSCGAARKTGLEVNKVTKEGEVT